jgi:hypothetical protein
MLDRFDRLILSIMDFVFLPFAALKLIPWRPVRLIVLPLATVLTACLLALAGIPILLLIITQGAYEICK